MCLQLGFAAATLLALTAACHPNDDGVESSADAGVDANDSTALCPEVLPLEGESCAELVGTQCLYDRCSAQASLIRATCEVAAPTPAWTIATETCSERSCQGQVCGEFGDICVANAGGAFIVGCAQHSCGDGPLTCDCVCGVGTQCERGDSVTGEALFTCYATCEPDPCA